MFGQANRNSPTEFIPFEDREPVFAVRCFRKLRGGSQATLIECSDGAPYVLKLNGNPTGPNTLANEVLGSTLATSLGLPTAKLVPVRVTEAFLSSNPQLAFKTDTRSYSALPGTHLGISFVGDIQVSSSVFQVLTPSHIQRIVNRECFLGIYLLDIAANHQDHRQALFVREGNLFSLRAVFIDHGQMFGGSYWSNSEDRCLPLHRNSSLYRGLWNELDVSTWITRLQERVPTTLEQSIPIVPRGWFDGNTTVLRDSFLRRLARLSQIAHQYRLAETPRPSFNQKAERARKVLIA